MSAWRPGWSWAFMVAILLAMTQPTTSVAQRESAGVISPLAAEEREACRRNLKVINDAIQAYQYDHKELPNWLSDLVPDYLSDGNVLICPVCRRTGRTEPPPLADPKLACSYIFEFSPVPVAPATSGEPRPTRREWKRRQMGLIGSVVPVVRCRHHNPVLNLAFNGSIYDSPPQWELLFTNRIRSTELSVASIFGVVASGEIVKDPTPQFSVAQVEPVQPRPTGRTIDLAHFFNADLNQSWQGRPGDDLASLTNGTYKLDGVVFDVRGVVQLKGQSPALAAFPREVKDIPIHRHCRHLYFLHAACVTGPVDEGEQIGAYNVHLSKTETLLEIPIYFGRSVADWHSDKSHPEDTKPLKVAWTGENAFTNQSGTRVRLFLTAWNLAPGVDIDSLDFVGSAKQAAPFLVAISYD
jgi:hypothetical protein